MTKTVASTGVALANIVFFVGTLYFLVERQVSLVAICAILFLAAFYFAIRLTPTTFKRCPRCPALSSKEDRYCAQCGHHLLPHQARS
jgi:hypothetical protein